MKLCITLNYVINFCFSFARVARRRVCESKIAASFSLSFFCFKSAREFLSKLQLLADCPKLKIAEVIKSALDFVQKKCKKIPLKMPLEVTNENSVNGNSMNFRKNGHAKNGQNGHSNGVKIRKNNHSFSSTSDGSPPLRTSSPTFSISES